MSQVPEKISGEYRHYKGKSYDVYCIAKDAENQEYVLYQKLYDDRSFWIRPKKMFFEEVEIEQKRIRRFAFARENQSMTEKIEKLAALAADSADGLFARHSENLQLYCVSISADKSEVFVAQAPNK